MPSCFSERKGSRQFGFIAHSAYNSTMACITTPRDSRTDAYSVDWSLVLKRENEHKGIDKGTAELGRTRHLV